jgi:hypothetical protein
MSNALGAAAFVLGGAYLGVTYGWQWWIYSIIGMGISLWWSAIEDKVR